MGRTFYNCFFFATPWP